MSTTYTDSNTENGQMVLPFTQEDTPVKGAGSRVLSETMSMPGRVAWIKYKDATSGWGVISFERPDGKLLTAAGNIAGVKAHDEITLTGHWEKHDRFGEEFKITAYVPQMPPNPASKSGVVHYLSRYIKGVGEKLAERIWDAFGEDTLEAIKTRTSEVAAVKGVGAKRAIEISNQAKNFQDIEQFALLEGDIAARFKTGPSLTTKIRERYGPNAIRIVEENPYRITELDGAGFAKAETIARALGFAADSPERIRAGILYTLECVQVEGHTRLPDEELYERTVKLLGAPVCGEDVKREAGYLAGKKRLLHVDTEGCGWTCLPKLYALEKSAADALVALKGPRTYDKTSARAALAAAEKEGTPLNAQQEEAVFSALGNGVSIITGGPGVGKTTVINALIRCLEVQKDPDEEEKKRKAKKEGKKYRPSPKVLLCAPTGRAAKRMGEASGHEAKTIHRALEFQPRSFGEGDVSGEFSRNSLNPFRETTVIADEMSMADVPLAAALFSAVKKGGRLVLVGDADQLPSVGPGSVFRDAIASGLFPVARLTINYRQGSGSGIVNNAALINKGHVPTAMNIMGGDFFFIKREEEGDAAAYVADRFCAGIPNMGIGPDGMQVLCPMKKGLAGTVALNTAIRERLNPLTEGKNQVIIGGEPYREGDRVMQTKNNYHLDWSAEDGTMGKGVFNGDTGVISAVDPEGQTVEVAFDDGRTALYGTKDIEQLVAAWAVTVHKSQGSEYPAVIIPLLWGPPSLLTRGLLYTAVTRARKCVIIVGRKRMLGAMVKNGFERKRYTGLCGMLLDQDVFDAKQKEREAAVRAREESQREEQQKEAAEREERARIRRERKMQIPGQTDLFAELFPAG